MFDYIVFDVEANGFKPSQMFCICVTDIITMQKKTFPIDQIAEACILLSQAKLVIGHAIRIYDCPVIERLTDGLVVFPETKKIDTLDMSRRLTKNKKHSLEFWGEIFGLPKLDQPLFESYDPAMLPYCERDVEITVKIFFHLLEIYLENDREVTFHNHEALDGFIDAFMAYQKDSAPL